MVVECSEEKREEIKLDNSMLNLREGYTSFTFILPNIQMNETIHLKLQMKNNKNELIQEYHIMSRENN